MKPRIYLFGFLILCLFGWTGLAAAAERPGDGPSPKSNAQISFQTLDGDVQQVNVDEIWRIRATFAHDEPQNAVVIDYGWERIFVKDRLESAVDKIRALRNLKKFTTPGGDPVYIVTAKITGIVRPIPNQHHENTKSIIVTREGQQQVRESREAVGDALK